MTNVSPQYFIGLMSGTSMDGIDAALVSIGSQHCQLIDTLDYQIPETLRQQVADLCLPGSNEIDRLGQVDKQLGEHFAAAALQLIERNNVAVSAIGSHGQTIRHRPALQHAFTLQIGDANIIAERCKITTVADFRRRDMAVGGQGAPLAPAFHQFAFASPPQNRAIINIGGMANITPLIKGIATQGFDSGPGNVLMDGWIKQQQGKAFDENGEWATSGDVDKSLLARLLSHPYLALAAPKSTGREAFNNDWLNKQISNEKAADVQATLLEFTAQTIADELVNMNQTIEEIYICGGGAYNQALMARLSQLLSPRRVASTSELGIAPEWVEAAAFAWLGQQTLNNLNGNIPAATGANRACILGAIYPA